MRDGRVILVAEKRAPGFYQLAGRRINLDGGDYHPLFGQRSSVGFNQYTDLGGARGQELRRHLQRSRRGTRRGHARRPEPQRGHRSAEREPGGLPGRSGGARAHQPRLLPALDHHPGPDRHRQGRDRGRLPQSLAAPERTPARELRLERGEPRVLLGELRRLRLRSRHGPKVAARRERRRTSSGPSRSTSARPVPCSFRSSRSRTARRASTPTTSEGRAPGSRTWTWACSRACCSRTRARAARCRRRRRSCGIWESLRPSPA